MCSARSVKVRKRGKTRENQLTFSLLFIEVLFVILFGLINFVKTLEKFYLKPKGMIWN